MKSQQRLKDETIDTMDGLKQAVDDPTLVPRPANANQEITRAYQRGQKKMEALGKKVKLPDWAKGELAFPPAREVTE